MNAKTKEVAGPEIKAEELEGLTKAEQADKITRTFMLWSAGGGLIPFPVWDAAAVYAAQITMLNKLSKVYDIPFSEHKGKNILLPLFGTIGLVPAAAGLLGSIVKIIPVVGQLAGVVSVPVMAAAITYATGKIFTAHFEAGGTLLDFKPDDIKEHYRELFEEGKAIAKEQAAK